MPELRRDPVVGYWTIISTERSRRPVEFKPRESAEEGDCPFCAPTDGPFLPVRVLDSKAPILSLTAQAERFGIGLYDVMEGTGKHEIIIESPKHVHDIDELDSKSLEVVVRAWVDRINDLEKDERFKFALLFKNHGLIFGSAQDMVRHTRSQLIALPITPKRVKEELLGAKLYFERRDRCVFCDIRRQETASGTRVVVENDSFFAFCPFASRSPFEIWILPKRHSPDFGRMEPAAFADYAAILKICLSKLRVLLNDPPYNLILHTAPYRHKKQAVYWKTIDEDYHWYLQISPRLTQNAGFEWGTGIHINPTPPEDAALLLREMPIKENA